MEERRHLAMIFVLMYIGAVLGLIVARFVFALAPASQSLVAFVAGFAVGLVASRRLDRRRLLWRRHTGRAAVALRLLLLLGIVASLLVQELRAQEDWPIFAVGLVLPAFLTLLFAIEASTLAEADRR